MKRKTCSLLLPLVILLLLVQKSVSMMNPDYVACKPLECGRLSISYPFYVPQKQPSWCGSQGFEVSCNPQNQTIINLSGDNYIINQINYQDLSVNITNSAFSGSVFDCLSSVHSLNFSPDSKFKFTSRYYKPKELLLLQNCSRNISSNKNYTKIKCKLDDDEYYDLFAVYKEDFHPEEVGKCNETVVMPYDEEQHGVIGFEGLLKKGVVLEYTANDCSLCQQSRGRCGFSKTGEFFCFCPDRNHRAHCHQRPKEKHLGIILGVIIAASLVGTVVLIPVVLFIKRQELKDKFTRDSQRFETFLENYGPLAPKRYKYSDIKKMTNSFQEKLGEGGFGGVYKGKLHDGRLVAIKLLKHSKGNGEDFINEVASITGTNHVNVVALLGFCCAGHKRALVYEFMANGSLEKFINDKTNCGQLLPLEKLFHVALGIARGLEYLHQRCNTRILHFDIKPHNILLDEDFCPKISDFGLAKVSQQNKQSHVSLSGIRGTIGYIAPEMFCRNFGNVSHKSDVYSYGMMVLEMTGSRKTQYVRDECSSELIFPQWIYEQLEHGDDAEVSEADQHINDEEKILKRKMIIVSLWCIQTVPSCRPSMSRVLQMLEGSLESIQIPPMPSLSSPPRPEFDLSGSSIVTLETGSWRTSS